MFVLTILEKKIKETEVKFPHGSVTNLQKMANHEEELK